MLNTYLSASDTLFPNNTATLTKSYPNLISYQPHFLPPVKDKKFLCVAKYHMQQSN